MEVGSLEVDPLHLCAPSVLTKLLREHRIRPLKSLGQHFIVDRNIVRRIVDAVMLDSDDAVLEIGTGLGTLAGALSLRCKQVITVEKDERLARIAKELLSRFANVRVIVADFLELDLGSLLSPQYNWKVVGNLPYYVTKPIIMHLTSHRHLIDLCVLTVQREVAQRMVARHGGKEYGLLSIAVQLFFEVELLFNIPPTCFMPPPKVTSTVVRLKALRSPRYELADETLFFELVRASFAERRKQLINSLHKYASRLSLSRSDLERMLSSIGIDPKMRAEQVSIDKFVRMANLLSMRLRKTGS
ncbi:MAG: hypothetical protein HZRFUVUK_001677 [Candidatus Fervidibacterota bacterium]